MKPGERVRSETSLAEGDELANTVVRDWPREVPRTTCGQEFPLVLFDWWSLTLRALQYSHVYSNWTKGSGWLKSVSSWGRKLDFRTSSWDLGLMLAESGHLPFNKVVLPEFQRQPQIEETTWSEDSLI